MTSPLRAQKRFYAPLAQNRTRSPLWHCPIPPPPVECALPQASNKNPAFGLVSWVSANQFMVSPEKG
jgi:hypothetical protein